LRKPSNASTHPGVRLRLQRETLLRDLEDDAKPLYSTPGQSLHFGRLRDPPAPPSNSCRGFGLDWLSLSEQPHQDQCHADALAASPTSDALGCRYRSRVPVRFVRGHLVLSTVQANL